jgi:hypothetical protein
MRDELLVTMGARAASMEYLGLIDLPRKLDGESTLAKFVVETVDGYINKNVDESFDIYIEAALEKEYGNK